MSKTFLRTHLYTILAILFATFSILLSYFTMAADDGVNVTVNVEGCNNNYVCEAVIGEDTLTCPNDCTTVTPPVTPPSDSGGNSGWKKKIPNITIVNQSSTHDTITIQWKSDVPTNASVSWDAGTGQSGIIREVGYVTDHSIYLTGLRAGAVYSIEISATDLYGMTATKNIRIKTVVDDQPVLTVQDFEIRNAGGGATLTWVNPAAPFEYIRIVRSDDFFPQDPYDGEVVYEGSAQSFLDLEVVEDVRYFYSIFTKSGDGFSNGVGESFMMNPEQDFFGDTGQPITTFGPIYDRAFVSNLNGSALQDRFHFYQNDNELNRVNNTYFVENKKEVLITIDDFPGLSDDKEMFISYFNSEMTARSRDYVFRYDNKDRKFSVLFPIMNEQESSPFIIYIRNNQEIKGYLGYFNTPLMSERPSSSFLGILLANDLIPSLAWMLLVVLFVNIWWIIFLRRKRKKNDQNPRSENL